RVVRGGEVDRPHSLTPNRFERCNGRRDVARAEVGLDVIEGQDARRFRRELLGEEAGVVGDDDAASLLARFAEVICDALAGDADVVESEILTDDAAPP